VTRHTLSVLVENKPGVLARVSSLFSRRQFNIHSLAVGPTENPEVSRMTIVVEVDDLPLEQVTKQLNKLINVLKIVELIPGASVYRWNPSASVSSSSREWSRWAEARNRSPPNACAAIDPRKICQPPRSPFAEAG
jgi:acetolactate synthase small subunit